MRIAIGIRIRRRRLVGELAAGADPAADARLGATASRLTAERRRRDLAVAVDQLIEHAERAPTLARVSPSRVAIRRNAASLAALAERLRDPTPVYAAGVASLELLLRDGAGPVYRDRTGDALAAALGDVDAALAGHRGRVPVSTRHVMS